MFYYPVSWSKLHKDTFRLAQKIEKSQEKVDLIIAIARGGLSIAHMLSDFLELHIATFTISSYKNLRQSKEPEILYKLGNYLDDKKILLVDDVSDTGKTFIRGIKYLKELKAKQIKTASIYLKPQSIFIPDYYVAETDKWIIFPYEIKETISAIKPKLKQEINKTKISKFWINKFT